MKLLKSVLFFLSAGVISGSLMASELEVSFGDYKDFKDFTLHEHESAEEARIIFGRELQRYWDNRLGSILPENYSLKIHFTDIDMAGRIEPWRHPTNKHIRYFANQFTPALTFEYEVIDKDGETVVSGDAFYRDKHFDFGGSAKMMRDSYAFRYELETLRKWMERRLKKEL